MPILETEEEGSYEQVRPVVVVDDILVIHRSPWIAPDRLSVAVVVVKLKPLYSGTSVEKIHY